MSTANVLMIISSMGAVICALIGVIYNILSRRIDVVSAIHNDLQVDISEIKTNISWIKKKLDTL